MFIEKPFRLVSINSWRIISALMMDARYLELESKRVAKSPFPGLGRRIPLGPLSRT
jgi:hypothetical protein